MTDRLADWYDNLAERLGDGWDGLVDVLQRRHARISPLPASRTHEKLVSALMPKVTVVYEDKGYGRTEGLS